MHVLTSPDRDQIAGLRERHEYFWLDLTAPTGAELRSLGSALGLDRRAADDLGKAVHLPRLEIFDAYVKLTYFGIGGGSDHDPFAPVQVRMVIAGEFIVTVHDVRCGMLEELADRVRQRLDPEEGAAVYRVLDVLTHSFFVALDAVDEEIDQIETEIVVGDDPSHLQRVVAAKNRLVGLRKVATAQRNVLDRADEEIGGLPGMEAGPHDFRTIYQRMSSVSELIDASRDLLTGVQNVYLSAVSNRLNQHAERLTLVATIFLPLTVLTGFFGMNFAWMTSRIDSFASFAIFGAGGVLALSLLALVLFWRAGFFERGRRP